MSIKCPKCHGPLLLRPADEKRYRLEYYCILCGIYGTLAEIREKIPGINKIFHDTIPTYMCSSCHKKTKLYNLKSVPHDGIIGFLCPDCISKQPVLTK